MRELAGFVYLIVSLIALWGMAGQRDAARRDLAALRDSLASAPESQGVRSARLLDAMGKHYTVTLMDDEWKPAAQIHVGLPLTLRDDGAVRVVVGADSVVRVERRAR